MAQRNKTAGQRFVDAAKKEQSRQDALAVARHQFKWSLIGVIVHGLVLLNDRRRKRKSVAERVPRAASKTSHLPPTITPSQGGILRDIERIMSDEKGASTASAVLATIGVIVLVVAIVVAGYLGGWWLQKDVQNRRARINRSTYEQQTTYRDEIVRKIADVRLLDAQLATNPDPDVEAQLQAQRRAVVDIVCRDNTHIQGGLDSASASFVERECA